MPKAQAPPSYAQLTIDEVKRKLKASESTAPGNDRLVVYGLGHLQCLRLQFYLQ